MLFLKTIEDIKIVPFLDYDKQGLFSDRVFLEDQYIPLYKNKIYVSDYRHALFLMVNDVKNNHMMGRINTYQKLEIPAELHMPVDLSSREVFISLDERLVNNKKAKVKIALLGGFGPAYGDNICGITAYKILQEELLRYFEEVKIDICHVQSNKFRDYYSRFGITIFQEPLELEKFCDYDFYYDITSINSITGYHTRSIVDSFLWMFSLDSSKIESFKKRITYLFPKEKDDRVRESLLAKGRKGRRLLFHPDSIQFCRNIPRDVCYKIIADILEKTDYDVFTVSDLQYGSPRFFNIKELSGSFDDFAFIISLMDKMVTVDTASYHVADAFSVPTLVLFTNAGVGRVSDYPQAKGYVVDQQLLEEVESIRASVDRPVNEYDLLNNCINSLWDKLLYPKIISFLLATE